MRRITVPTVQAGHAIGVDLGGTKILAGVVARDGSVVRRHERLTAQDSQEHVLTDLEAAVAELLDESVVAVGFGVPSPIDQARGVVVRSVNLPLEDAPLRDRMRARFGIAVGLDNDANAAAIGEWRAGAGRGEDDLVMLTLGTGVGGGVVSSGKPFRGRNGSGVELGHVVIVHGGRPCQGACAGRGHLEAYVSGSAATAAAREAFGPSADAHRLVRLANEGDGQAKELLEEVGRYLGSGIGSFVNIFGPQLVVVGGGFGVAAYEYLHGPAEEIARREALEPMRSALRLAKAELGTAAGLIGAAFVGFEALDAAENV
jgi:glucokinase